MFTSFTLNRPHQEIEERGLGSLIPVLAAQLFLRTGYASGTVQSCFK